MGSDILKFSPKIIEAREKHYPIIALESSIISHGMPYPENLFLAKKLKGIAEDNNVTPATICLMDGKIKIGLDKSELKILATSKNVKKVSGRDMGDVITKHEIGSTTVSATIRAAHLAGIEIIATGGIGGIHRELNNVFDISADLVEISRTPVIVISAGVKAFLDIPKTLEMMETLSIPVYGYKTSYFPAFYSNKTNLKIDKIDNIKDIAKIYKINKELGFKQGILFTNPIPKKYEISTEKIEKYINAALKKVKKLGFTGKAVTPALLSEINKISNGKTLNANIKLVENNVKLACSIAKYLSS